MRMRMNMGTNQPGHANRSPVAVFVLALVALVFTTIGGGGILKLAGDCVKVRNWVETPATLHSCTLSSHQSGGRNRGTVYCPQVSYTYSYAGREYTGETFDNIGGASSFFRVEKAKVDRHPAGETVVWVNPERPDEAVLERAMRPPWFLCMFFCVFAVVGLSIAFFLARTLLSRLHPEPERSFFMQPLKPSMPNEIKGLAFFAMLWNGIAWTLATMAFSDIGPRDMRDFGNLFPLIMVSIFPLIGCGMVVKVLWQLVGYWSGSRHAVSVTCSALRPGARMQVVYGMDDEPAFEKLAVSIIADSSELSGGKGRVPPSCHREVLSLDKMGPLKSGSFDCTIPELHAESNSGWRLQFRYSGASGRSRLVDYRLE